MQATEKFTFLKLYADSISKLAEGNEQLAKDLCRKLIQYGIYGIEEESNDAVLEAMFISFRTMIDRGREIAIANSENGKKGGRPTKAKKTETKAKQNPTESETKANESKIENRNNKIENRKEEINNNIILKNDTETKVSERGNEEINKCVELIKSYNGGIIDGTIKNSRNYSKLLIDKLKKLESVQNGKFTRFETLEIILKVVSQNKFQASKITSPELIYRNLAILMQTCKNDITKQQSNNIVLETI